MATKIGNNVIRIVGNSGVKHCATVNNIDYTCDNECKKIQSEAERFLSSPLLFTSVEDSRSRGSNCRHLAIKSFFD